MATVVRKVDNAIHLINHYPVDSVVCFVNTIIYWVAIYLRDVVYEPLNNQHLVKSLAAVV